MRDLLENASSQNPIEAVRRDARPALRQRFYGNATISAIADGYALRLDDKIVHTPGRRLLGVPTLALAEALAAEWNIQRDVINPAKMPLTRLANAIIDGVADAPRPVAEDVAKFLASDLLFYRASGPPELRERQARHWDPILAWAREALGAHFKLAEGVIHVAQPEAAVAAACAAIPDDPWQLGAVHAATTLTGSALLALAVTRRQLSADAAWLAAHIDEDWNFEQWGRDETALERRALQFAEFLAATRVLNM